MGCPRWAGRLAGALAWACALAPIAALGPAAVVDIGPDGAARPSPFPVALAVFDPLVWSCARNSLVMALAVTLSAGIVGVGLARVARGRGPLTTLACAGVAVPPGFGAVGLAWWLGRDGPAAWGAWYWAALLSSAPVVGLATAAALRTVEPAWEEAGRLAGASRRRAWRQLVWPVVRPEVARALGLVFGLTLLDPTAPLVLGLRRTLGVQVVEAAWAAREPGRLARAVVIALAGTAAALVALELLRWWGGARPGSPQPGPRPSPVARPRRESRIAASLRSTAFLAAAALVWVPIAALPAAALELGRNSPGRAGAFAVLVHDPLTQRYLLNALVLGAAATLVDLILARAAVSTLVRGRWASVARWPGVVPPLAIGVGALALPTLVDAAAGLAASAVPGSPLGYRAASALRGLAGWLDLDRAPGVLLVLGVATARSSLVVRSAVARHRRVRASEVDAAVVLGATPRRARRALAGRWLLGVAPAAALLTFATAATSPVPALVLAPTAETRPVGPAILALADSPDGPHGLPQAAALATAALALNLTACALATRGRGDLVGAWLRG